MDSYTVFTDFVTGQLKLDSYTDAGVLAAVKLVNGLTPGFALGKPTSETDTAAVIREVLAVDPPSAEALQESDIPGFVDLAGRLRIVFTGLDKGDIDSAANVLNELLSRYPASPYLAREQGVWRLHHHPADAPVLPMWTAICAESLARIVGMQAANRLGLCSASRCDRVFVDTSRNATRRFCSPSCQNRAKTAAFRSRHRRATGRDRRGDR